MRRYLSFLAIGSAFATVEEFLTVVVLRRDVGSYIFTLLILFPAFLTFVFFSSRLLARLVRARALQEAAHYLIYGLAGLLIEWFVIGLAPWRDPSANLLLLLLFNFGMFSFWATVAYAPRLLTQSGELARRARRGLLRFCIPYAILTYLLAFAVPANFRFIVIIGLIILGYSLLNVFYFGYFRSLSPAGPPRHTNEPSAFINHR